MGNGVELLEAVKGFDKDSYAILYSPKECHLAKFDGNGFLDVNGEIDVSEVYEARVFNSDKELRWVEGFEPVEISDAKFSDCEKNEDIKYLFWGKKNGEPSNGWTEFAEARIGKFFVPKEINSEYAQFTAVEYLKEFKDGNVAVFDERLTGISEVGNV